MDRLRQQLAASTETVFEYRKLHLKYRNRKNSTVVDTRALHQFKIRPKIEISAKKFFNKDFFRPKNSL